MILLSVKLAVIISLIMQIEPSQSEQLGCVWVNH